MDYLPRDILYNICKLLDLRDILRLCQCSKRLLLFVHNCSSLCINMTSIGLHSVISLDLTAITTDNSLKVFINTYPLVSSLRLKEFRHGKHIRQISAGNTMTSRGLHSVGEHCSNLKELRLFACSQANDFGIKSVLSGCKAIEVLLLDRCGITNNALTGLAEECRTSVEHVSLQGCYYIDDMGLRFLSTGCVNLRILNVVECGSITDAGLKYISRCHKLQELDLAGCHKINDTGLRYIGNGCTMLISLNLNNCSNISSTGVKHIAEGCTKLEKLFLRTCFRLHDTGLRYLASHCVNLKQLNLTDCRNVTDAGLQYLASGCPNIQQLSLFSEFMKIPITNAGLKHFAKAQIFR